jgi:hypothetical protein
MEMSPKKGKERKHENRSRWITRRLGPELSARLREPDKGNIPTPLFPNGQNPIPHLVYAGDRAVKEKMRLV